MLGPELADGRLTAAGRRFDECLTLHQALRGHWGQGISACNQTAQRVVTHGHELTFASIGNAAIALAN